MPAECSNLGCQKMTSPALPENSSGVMSFTAASQGVLNFREVTRCARRVGVNRQRPAQGSGRLFLFVQCEKAKDEPRKRAKMPWFPL